jgi:hypothetical protein
VAIQTTGSNKQKSKRPRLTYFFVNDQLHKKLHINRAKDMLTAWNYPRGQRVKLNYTDTLRMHEKAFTTRQVAEMMNRQILAVELAITKGNIPAPQHSYGINEARNKFAYFWREKDIVGLHEYLSNVQRGRPRKDGLVTPWHLPTPRELRAMIHDEAILYVKQGDQFVPTWKAKDF